MTQQSVNSATTASAGLPAASVSLDLDNLWAYLKTHGDSAWQSYPGFLETAIPRFLDFFRDRSVSITVFVVGKDAILDSNQDLLRSIAEAGHEIGNHSFHHEPWLQKYRRARLEQEIDLGEQAIYRATGVIPRGFRGPGFSFNDQLLSLLAERGYVYDASTFPTFLGPAARTWYFLKSRFSAEEKAERKQLFGKFADGFQPIRPYCWQVGQRRLLEIPVTTMPLFKLPIHASYFMYLASFNTLAARSYLWSSLKLCSVTGTPPSMLLHALDFLDDGDVPQLAFFPGMQYPWQRKLGLLHRCLDLLERHWRPGTLLEQARLCQQHQLKTRPLKTAAAAPVSPV